YYGAKMINYSNSGFYFESNYPLNPGAYLCVNRAHTSPGNFHVETYKVHRMEVRWCHKLLEKHKTGYGVGVKYIDPIYYQKKGSSEEVYDDTLNLLRDRIIKPSEIQRFVFDYAEQEKRELDLQHAKELAEKRANNLAVLNRLAIAVSSTLDLDKILQTICEEMVGIFDARNTGICLLNEEKTKINLVAFHSSSEKEDDATGLELLLEGNAATLLVLETGQSIVVPDVQNNPITESYHDISRKRGTQCIMIVPLLARGEVIGTIGMPTSDKDRVFTYEEVSLAQTIASQIASAIHNARLHTEIQRDLEMGRQIQTSFFPQNLPTLPGWEIATYFQAARQVAGDFYDVFHLPNNQVGFVIADVCDKGVGSALFMGLIRSLIRIFSGSMSLYGISSISDSKKADCLSGPSLSEDENKNNVLKAVSVTNDYIANEHGQLCMFTSLFFGILDPGTGIFTYINSGHEPPLIISSAGGIKRKLKPTGPVVGMKPNVKFSTNQVEIESGDILIGYTDGVTEALASNGELFSREQLLSLLEQPSVSASDIIEKIKTRLSDFISDVQQSDDVTLIAVQRLIRTA
ncbi:MAG: SpoIIE family protein phosphatase, partial [Desulfobacterales bacterium]